MKRPDLNIGAGIEVATTPEWAREFLAGALVWRHPCLLQAWLAFETKYVVHCV
jgi:hypothetical protein